MKGNRLHTSEVFLLTPLREGRLRPQLRPFWMDTFLLTPLREGRRRSRIITSAISSHFYSRPCGRGDASTGVSVSLTSELFLLTPLREGRRDEPLAEGIVRVNFYSRPCGRGDLRRNLRRDCGARNFYSRPCGRGDGNFPQVRHEVLRQIAER